MCRRSSPTGDFFGRSGQKLKPRLYRARLGERETGIFARNKKTLPFIVDYGGEYTDKKAGN
jgi:hypothetical protein